MIRRYCSVLVTVFLAGGYLSAAIVLYQGRFQSPSWSQPRETPVATCAGAPASAESCCPAAAVYYPLQVLPPSAPYVPAPPYVYAPGYVPLLIMPEAPPPMRIYRGRDGCYYRERDPHFRRLISPRGPVFRTNGAAVFGLPPTYAYPYYPLP